MEEKFKEIDIRNEKINKIINSAFKEFSKNNFSKASTNNIIKEAGVSRGLLYYYFKDKQELYDFLIYYSMETMLKTLNEKLNWEETDIFNRIRETVKIKFEVVLDFPYLIEFYKIITEERIDEIKDEMQDFNKKFFTLNISNSKFKKNIDLEKVMNTSYSTLEALGKIFMKKMNRENIKKQTEEFLKELDDYIEFFKDSFYQN